MKILRNTIPVSDIFNLMKSGELTINRSYQRGKGLWPSNARSYFIDTVLNDFPFPKVVLRQVVDIKTKKSKREIIDGQQRLTTIRDFIENKFKLSSVSKKYAGMSYEDLPEDVSSALLSYEVSIDNIVTATNEEILEVFRRINSYTLPLNTSEKRHATFQGKFKWYISNMTEYFTPFFERYDTLSIRDISRMMDADLLTECCQLCIEGIQNRTSTRLDNIYKLNDVEFIHEDLIDDKVINAFNFIKDNLTDVFEECKVPSYLFYSLMGALIFNRYGLSDSKGDLRELTPIQSFVNDINGARDNLIRIFSEAIDKVEYGQYPEFVKASVATTQSYKNRLLRIKTLINVLQE